MLKIGGSFFVLIGLLLFAPQAHAAGCQWNVKGKVLASDGKAAKGVRVKIRARWSKPRGLWNDANWPDPRTNSSGQFSVRSRKVHPCNARRDIEIKIHDGHRWVPLAQKDNQRRGTINFGEEESDKLYNIKCYAERDDRDGDGYAKTGSTVTKKTVVRARRYQCPSGYVSAKDDCDDTNPSIHPNRWEAPKNGVDDNCEGGADETSYVYWEKGRNVTANGFNLRAIINSPRVIRAAERKNELFAQVRYRQLSHTNDRRIETPRRRVKVKRYRHSKLGRYWGTDFTLSRLKRSTLYQAEIRFFLRQGTAWVALTEYQGTPYYSSTNGASNQSTRARVKNVLRGLSELMNQQLGRIGRYGTKWINGTRYGATVGDWWCSEFYIWASKKTLKTFGSARSVKGLKAYFGQGYRTVETLSDLSGARPGDWLAMKNENHTGMFLGKRQDGKIVTLEGNVGNTLKVIVRNLSAISGFASVHSKVK